MAEHQTGRVAAYHELPRIDAVGARHSWGVFGDGDDVGTVNNMAPATVLDGVREVREGRVFRLDLPLGQPDPPLYGRTALRHDVFPTSRHTWDDALHDLNTQASTQWDGLRHIRCREFGFYGGITADPTEHDALGIDKWARTGIVGRGVLADVAGWWERGGIEVAPTSGRPITTTDLEAVLQDEDVALQPGDVLLVRTGWLQGYERTRSGGGDLAPYQAANSVGLAADEAMAAWLWDAGLVAVAADNPALEPVPGDPAVGSLHRRLIPLLGFAVGELFALDELAEHCAARRCWTFLFVATPLHLRGGVASPGNAVAIV
jgi:kynurenine formamidase